MAGVELFFAIVFFVEFTLRLASMRSSKRFFKNVFNWVEFLVAVGVIVELTVYCVGMQRFAFTVWGLAHPMWLFYPVDTFRLVRVLVVIRFLVMQKSLHSMTLIVRTFKIAMPKVMIALYFMFLFISIF